METLNCIESNPAAMVFVVVGGIVLGLSALIALARLVEWLWRFLPCKVERTLCKLGGWIGNAIGYSALTILALIFLWGAWETLLCVIN